MSEGRLDDAIRALRDATDGRSDQTDQMERAIIERVSRTRPRSRGGSRVPRLRLGLAFALLSSSVWAIKGEAGSRFLTWLGVVGAENSIEEAAPGDAPSASLRLNAPAADEQNAPSVDSVEAPVGEEPTERGPNPPPQSENHSESLRGRPAERHLEAAMPLDPGSSDPEPGDASPEMNGPIVPPAEDSRPPRESMALELRLYREAREAFMNGGENARVLKLWDRYLAEFPAGTFVPEARFSRAVCLLRLGHKSQAKSELEVFSNGSGYRKREAQELLSTLRGDSNGEGNSASF